MKPVLKAWIGAAVWVAFLVARQPRPADDGWTLAAVVFVAAVLLPLALEIFAADDDVPDHAGRFGWAQRIQLPAALTVTAACLLPAGTVAGLLTLPWMGLMAWLGWIGLGRMRQGGLRRSMPGLCADVALLYGVVGGIWLLADRAGHAPLGFDRSIVALTAAHFHYAGLLLPRFAGLVCREMWMSRFASRAAVGVLLGVPAVAFGITATQLGWGPTLEAAAGGGLALAGMAVAVLHVRLALDAPYAAVARVSLGLAGVALFFAMVFAGLYAIRGYVVLVPLGLPVMRLVHGTSNVLGVGLCGVLGWRAVVTKPKA